MSLGQDTGPAPCSLMTIVTDGAGTIRAMRIIHAMLVLVLSASSALAQTAIEKPPDTTPAPSKFRSSDDGWFDVSGFLDEKYGFLPLIIPITEPAGGYGAAGALTFFDQPRGETRG